MPTLEESVAAGLRAYAAGNRAVEAATEGLIRLWGGRFAHDWPWIHHEDDAWWVAWDEITDDATRGPVGILQRDGFQPGSAGELSLSRYR